MSDETTRLRALLDQTEMPWRAVDVVDSGTVLGRGTAILRPHSRWLVRRVAEIDMGDGEERDTAHAALIVAAVNSLPGLLDAAERAECERDVLRAQQAPLLDAHDALVAAARAAGWTGAGATGAELVAWVRRGEREACARVADDEARDSEGNEGAVCAAQSIAATIRGRKGGE